LPSEFFEKVPEDLETLDLLIIAGTSLTVAPANELVYSVPDETIRVVVDVNPVGQELGIDYSATRARDFFAQGPCDEVFLDLITELGWLDDLNTMKDLLPQASVELLEKKLQQ
jgi:NAD-dependent SIR2 family protein deacetylase